MLFCFVVGRLDDARDFEPEVRKDMIRFLRRQHLLAQWDPSKMTDEFQSHLLQFLDSKLLEAKQRSQDLSELQSVIVRDQTVVNKHKTEQEQMWERISSQIIQRKLTELEKQHRSSMEIEYQQMV